MVLLGGASLVPLAARAQQAMPVVGFINPTSPEGYPHVIAAFHRGLGEQGYIEGRNVAIEYRWANGHHDRLPALANELVRRKVAVIAATGGDASPRAARAATATIPIVFNSAGDPVKTGLVASFNRPGGNLTGVSRLNTELLPKRLELLAEVVSGALAFACLINPRNLQHDERAKELESAGRTFGRQVHIYRAANDGEMEEAFAAMAKSRVDGLLIVNDTYFNTRSEKLGALAVHHKIPAVYQNREFAAAGGLMSYGPGLSDAYRIVGTYVGRILKGEKPADLPVQQQTKVDFFVNLKTARALGLTVPLPLIALADEVIE